MIVSSALRETVRNFGEHGRSWLESLPATLDRLVERWNLIVERDGPDGSCSYVVIVRRPSGERAMLKVPVPHREATHEPDALRVWDGDGAVRLLELDDSGAMLLELADPGTPLAKLDDHDGMARIGGELARHLQRPVPDGHPFELLTDVCAEWAQNARQRVRTLGAHEDIAIVDEGAELLETLPRETDEHVLLHGDFHHWNVLASRREPWLAIDAKPMVGDPVFDAAQFLGNHNGIAGGGAAFVRGVDTFADASGFDPQRMLLWVLAKTAEDAMWDLSVEDREHAAGTLEYARYVKVLIR